MDDFSSVLVIALIAVVASVIGSLAVGVPLLMVLRNQLKSRPVQDLADSAYKQASPEDRKQIDRALDILDKSLDYVYNSIPAHLTQGREFVKELDDFIAGIDGVPNQVNSENAKTGTKLTQEEFQAYMKTKGN